MTSTIIPGLRYVDAPAEIEFLVNAFGFARHAVYADEREPSLILHAQLTLNGGMIMLGSARPGPQDLYPWRTPAEAGGVTTSLYVVVPDADAHAAVARAAGAHILDGPKDNEGYPGRGYSARDPEGFIWSFGTYDPWKAP
jgi:uncharacterized glyoxalase superfamily protein PhnB